MGKLVVLKPVVWNDKGYVEPAGAFKSTGYAGDHGYGHEEWNGNSEWVWDGWRVFHTEAQPIMHRYAERGDLGIIMTARHNGRYSAVGAAAAVFLNSASERKLIARELDLLSNESTLWELDSVRQAHKSRTAFHGHWVKNHAWVQWRCPPSHLVIFQKPVPFLANDIIPNPPGQRPRQDIVKRHKGCQPVRPDQALALVDQRLPSDHPIILWLRSGDFDEKAISKGARTAAPPKRRRAAKSPMNGQSASTASAEYIRYLTENEILITPRHYDLQERFRIFLNSERASAIEGDRERVDMRYTHVTHGLVFAEIKPADPPTVRYAIRAAIGQLLDYRQKAGCEPKLQIVVGCKPESKEDREFALSNGFGLAWPNGEKDGFTTVWPPDAEP